MLGHKNMAPRTHKKPDVPEQVSAPDAGDDLSAQEAAKVLVGDMADTKAPADKTIKPSEEPTPVFLLSGGKRKSVPRDSIIIVCREQGFRRAGVEHPPVAVYAADHFSAYQLTLLRAEPVLEVIGVAE